MAVFKCDKLADFGGFHDYTAAVMRIIQKLDGIRRPRPDLSVDLAERLLRQGFELLRRTYELAAVVIGHPSGDAALAGLEAGVHAHNDSTGCEHLLAEAQQLQRVFIAEMVQQTEKQHLVHRRQGRRVGLVKTSQRKSARWPQRALAWSMYRCSVSKPK